MLISAHSAHPPRRRPARRPAPEVHRRPGLVGHSCSPLVLQLVLRRERWEVRTSRCIDGGCGRTSSRTSCRRSSASTPMPTASLSPTASGCPSLPRGPTPLADLTRALARGLIAAGFEIHDCAGKAPGAGVCLTPGSNAQGVIVTWTQPTPPRPPSGLRPPRAKEHMNCALADVLTMIGYPVEGFGQATAHLVTGPRMVDDAAGDDEPAGEGLRVPYPVPETPSAGRRTPPPPPATAPAAGASAVQGPPYP